MSDESVAPTHRPAYRISRTSWHDGAIETDERMIPEEIAIAFIYNFSSHAVMMATPSDLTDFATGFSLTDGIVGDAEEIEAIETIYVEDGIELRISLAVGRRDAFLARRRHLAGPTGCGLCGIEALAQAVRPPCRVASETTLSDFDIATALAAMADHQTLNRMTHAVHAAAFWQRNRGLVALREDVGRHNALDKLAGALAREHMSATHGAILLTSRVSVEMVQKATMIGAAIIVAVSAPTALAIRLAEAAGVTLVAIARRDGFEVFTHSHRIRRTLHSPRRAEMVTIG
jgi:FdhD protein